MSIVTPQVFLSTLNGLDPDNDPDLAGLGAATKQVIRTKVANAANAALRMEIASKDVKKLISRQNLLPASVQQKIANGELGIEYYDLYRNLQVVPGANAITNLIVNNVNIDPGLTNFKDDKMPEEGHMVISSIQIAYGYDAGGAINDARLIEYSPFGNVPICFQNAVLHVRIGTTYIIENLPLRNFFAWESNAAPDAINRMDYAFEIQKDNIIWSDGTKLQVQIEFAAGSTVAPYLPAGDHYLSVHLYGAGVAVTQAK